MSDDLKQKQIPTGINPLGLIDFLLLLYVIVNNCSFQVIIKKKKTLEWR